METKYRVFKTDKDGNVTLYGYERLTGVSGTVWERKSHPNGLWVKGVFGKGLRSRFSGHFDKSRNEIYEGDILELINEVSIKIQVTCRFGHAHREVYGTNVDIIGFYFELPNGKKSFPVIDNYVGKHDCQIMEIVGNIYENKEYLKE
ncbi:hypothetical protein IR083_10025 [Dysgonomonas sp. GY75]|uniref:YopX family protein n=1 Tax=Dysgonomonas sp. GY75 TaxID=2780419 RepID=UPI001883144B|nr:YopX family protein [Dysgonomonas sp. GY75]MBF0649157.1 hypothetical protein [Dysgonomonas sp. GY75]